MRPGPDGAEGGFTLLEALAALTVVSAIAAALAVVSGQWMLQWRHGYLALQNADQIALCLDRLAADLSAAEYARLDPGAGAAPFRGSKDVVIFVRRAIGPDAAPQLEYVRISAVATRQGLETQRARAKFAPGPIGTFRDAVTVLRAPFRLTFAYQAPDGSWTPSWGEAATLPRAIRLTVGVGAAMAASTAFALKTTSGPDLLSQPLQAGDEPSAAEGPPK